MEFNPSKCQVRVTTARVIINTVYLLHGQVLEVVTSAKYLAGRRRVVESGPAEVSGECQRYESRGGGGGKSTKGGFPPLVRGFGWFPPRKF